MLVLGRRDGEGIQIGDDITVAVKILGDRVRLVIEAPKDVRIVRTELLGALRTELESARMPSTDAVFCYSNKTKGNECHK